MNHTGQYKYFCVDCDRGFARKYVYEEHMMTVHMVVKKTEREQDFDQDVQQEPSNGSPKEPHNIAD